MGIIAQNTRYYHVKKSQARDGETGDNSGEPGRGNG
jgi:hypothetical protein